MARFNQSGRLIFKLCFLAVIVFVLGMAILAAAVLAVGLLAAPFAFKDPPDVPAVTVRALVPTDRPEEPEPLVDPEVLVLLPVDPVPELLEGL